ncbi:MAG: dTDP-glucose 4,6-dehydratase [Methanocellales archaeon]|nr:dTDP-glucose 4,6-dehydratase [Methanocellales archaeon]
MVTGGAGFIGSNFVKFMLRWHPADQIVVLDKLTYAGDLDNLKTTMEKIEFIKGDICNRELVEKVAKGVDVIINFAAESHVDRSIAEPEPFLATNVLGTQVLLEAARRFDHEKFVQISTDEVYGSISEGSFKEEDLLRPSSPYAASKAAADMLARSYFVTYGVPVLITRSTNNFGLYQHPEKFIPKLIINAISGKPLPIYGDGKNVRDWLYVIDNCEAIDLILRKGKSGEIYNVGAGNEKTNLEIAKFILEELGKPKSLIKFVKDRPGHDLRYSLDWSKIKELGWTPKHSFDAALKKTVKWYIENEWWWKPKQNN